MQTTRADTRNLSLGSDSSALPPRVDTALPGGQGMLRVVSPQELVDYEEAAAEQARLAESANQQAMEGLASYVRQRYSDLRSIRESKGLSNRLVESLRAYRGQYSPAKLAEIRKFNGSDVYARTAALKCRGASAMLRDIYLTTERPWSLDPSPDPKLPGNILQSVMQLANIEAQGAAMGGEQVPDEAVQQRVKQLMAAAEQASLKQAREEADKSTRYIDDLLVEGGFYQALTECLITLPVFPYAVMKGPVVRMATDVRWVNGQAEVQTIPKMFWYNVSPFDFYWDMSARSYVDSDVIEHLRLSRKELNDLLDVPGYRQEAVAAVLEEYGRSGLSDWRDTVSQARADLETREDEGINRTGLIDTLEFHGYVQGQMLLDMGMSPEEIEDPVRDYFANVWVIGRHVIKAQLDPDPRHRHPFFMTSFEKVPHTDVGHGVPEIINDVTSVMNATLRALVNNLSIASGPQVMVNDDRQAPNADSDSLYPWKRWHVVSDPMGTSEAPVSFYQPNSNSQELIAVYQYMSQLADEVSSIPRYMTGNERVGGAGRTASGLGMLMQNAGKVMQSVAANIDQDIIEPAIQKTYDTVMLTDSTGRLKGDEEIRVRGVTFAQKREQDRARLMEFLQITSNDIDMQLLGPENRAELLREIAERIGLDHLSVVPTEDELTARNQANMMAQAGQPGPGNPEPQPKKPPGEAGRVDEGQRNMMRGPSGNTV